MSMFKLTQRKVLEGDYYVGLRFNPEHAEHKLGVGSTLYEALQDMKTQVANDLEQACSVLQKKEKEIEDLSMKKEHFFFLERQLSRLVFRDLVRTMELMDQYENGLFPGVEKVTDLNRKFCFDMLQRPFKENPDFREFIRLDLYSYLDDEEMYQALRLIVPTVEKKY